MSKDTKNRYYNFPISLLQNEINDNMLHEVLAYAFYTRVKAMTDNTQSLYDAEEVDEVVYDE